MKIVEKEFNAITNEEIIIERDETDAEKNIRLKELEDLEQLIKDNEKNKIARQQILERLGLNEDEIKVLLG